MRSIITKVLVASIALTLFATIAIADKKKKNKEFTLPNGKVLINPFVISENPNGLEVGHNNGIIQLQFKDLPENIQKKYGYSPEKAVAYNKQQAKKKKERKKYAAEENRKKKVQDEKFRRYRRDASEEKLQIDIKKTENRIAELKREIPQLEQQQNNLLDKTTSMASTSVAGDSGGRSYNSWYGGYSFSSGSNTAGNEAERTKKRQISKLDDEYATTKHRLRTYKKELSTKEINIIKMKNRLEKIKKQKAKEPSLPKK